MPTANKGKDFDKIPEGMHIAVCIGVIDLGTQKSVFEGKEKWQLKVCLIWEFPNLPLIEVEGKGMMPRIYSRIFTNSLDPRAALKKILESWRGSGITKEEEDSGIDLGRLAGVNCQVQIIHEGDYANIGTIVPVPEGMQVIPSVHPHVIFDIGDEIPTDRLPDWICERIGKAQELNEPKGVVNDLQAQDESTGQYGGPEPF